MEATMKTSIITLRRTPLHPDLRATPAHPRRFLGPLIVALLGLSSCIDFGPVREYAALSKQASTGYFEIVQDLYQSCLRSAEFDSPADGGTPEAHCAEWKKVQPGLLKAESTLQDYLVAIGKLAGDETVSYDENLDSLRQALENTTLSGKAVFDSKQVDAATGIAGFMLKAATDAYRRRELERAFSSQNENVKTVTAALKEIVGHDYEKRLENEETAITAFQVRVQRASDQSLAAEIGRREAQEHLWDIAKKREAADSYVKTLDLIAKGHQQLYEHKKELSSKDLAKSLADDVSKMIPLIQSIQKAF
jgi:hypothetical protein